MSEWLLPTVAVLLIGYAAVSGRLQSTEITSGVPPGGVGSESLMV